MTLEGQTVDDRWYLVRRIGSGRFGEVYAAEARHLDLAAGAVKFVRPESPDHREQVLREIQALSELSHENLVTYRDSGRINEGALAGSIYIVTELCDGTLRDESGWGSSDPEFQERLAASVSGVAAGLAYLHGRGYIHRDIKPANILRAENRWLVSDFGLVRDTSEPTRRRRWQGTAPYLAPEAVSRDGAGAPADVYALGVVVHEALTGQWPYAPRETTYERPPLASGAALSISDELPAEWRGLVEACLARDPSLRPPADEIGSLIPAAVKPPAGVRPAITPSSTLSVDTLPPRRGISRTLAVVFTLILAGFVAVGVWLIVTDRDDEPESRQVATTVSDPTTDSRGRMVITSDMTLDSDLQAGVVIAADDVVLDCDGHAVTGDGTSDMGGITIESGVVGATVANCVVSGFPVGIDVSGDHSIVESNRLTENDYGLWVSSFKNVIRANVADSNEHDGFTVQGLGSNTIEDNTSDANGTGLVIESESTNNVLRANSVTRNGGGFHIVDGTVGNTLEENTATGNVEGFADFSRSPDGDVGTGNFYDNNTCSGNATNSLPNGLCS